ncbi:gamma-glutamyl-gamma-aminobutyrate hydrolase family protein [Streptomyces sp. NPDC048282]|uniref:gamma-glutamyl-gamma-aminobutyrate hydrolase family protein n=1 Tax=unclassified Streptomyces TaxID=2593676 RepID=UPI00372315D6
MPDRGAPLIGIPVAVERARWRVWSGPAYLLAAAYADRVWQAGAVPVLLPVGGAAEDAARVVGSLDGLILAGGADVHPCLYRQDPHPSAGPFAQERDVWESALLLAALSSGLPVLGICRGMQLLNVVLGGTLTQHLPDSTGTDLHNPVPGEFALHRVRTAPGSRIRRILGAVSDVPTYHHQAVESVAADLAPVAWADDGTVEALEDGTGRVLAVQWHPETGESTALMDHFAHLCSQQCV